MFNQKKNSAAKPVATNNSQKPANEKNKNKKKKKKTTIAKTVQQSIPWLGAYSNGVIEIEPNVYSKSYEFTDINFVDAMDADQFSMKEQWGKVLCMFTPDMNVELSIFNRIVDESEVYNNILLKPKSDSYNLLREEANKNIKDRMTEGQNNLECEKYLTVSFQSASVKNAFNTFAKLDTKLERSFSAINENISIAPIPISKRLSIFYDIYNPYSKVSFDRKYGITKTSGFNLDYLAKAGLSSKDAIAPSDISFKSKYISLGDKFAKTVYIDNLPAMLSADFLCDVANRECSAITSVHFKQLDSKKASSMIQNKTMDINRAILEKQKDASREGYSAALVSPNLQQMQLDASDFQEEMMTNDQKAFIVTIAMTLFANTQEELDANMDVLEGIAARYVCDIKVYKNQQEAAFNTTLPLANNKVFIDRLMHTDSASILIPFSTQEISQENGLYYGTNAVSKRLLRINKFGFSNANAMFLGKPGSGKSMQAKWEIIMTMLGTDDDIYIIDPEDEYRYIAELFPNDAEVIDLKPGATKWINPMDLDIDDTDGADPIATKCSYMYGFMSMVFGDNFVLSPTQKSILTRCVTMLYEPYIKHLENRSNQEGTRISFDYEAAPTLIDLHDALYKQDLPEAAQMGLALEQYCIGPNAIFSNKTNVNPKKRMIIYNVRALEGDLKLVGLYTCMSHSWNRMISNSKIGRGTDIYIDEFHLLLSIPSVLSSVLSMYKRARKFIGAMRGLTQNITDLFASADTLKILATCDFVVMMNQFSYERDLLAKQYNLSDAELTYITNATSGSGLIYAGKNIYPFENLIEKDSIFYKAMSSNCKERAQKKE